MLVAEFGGSRQRHLVYIGRFVAVAGLGNPEGVTDHGVLDDLLKAGLSFSIVVTAAADEASPGTHLELVSKSSLSGLVTSPSTC
jgi:hypothetical protein